MCESQLVLLIESDSDLRQSLLGWLWRAIPGWHAIGAPNEEAAIAAVEAGSPAVILVDVTDPGMDWLKTIRQIKRAAPGAAVIALTLCEDETYRDDLAAAGASAALPIWSTHTELPPIMRALLVRRC